MAEKIFTKKDLTEMWKRPVERQYNIALTKMMEAINETKGDITLCVSGGKDSTLLADMYCDLIAQSPYKDILVKLAFANTTNETSEILKFVYEFNDYLKQKYGVNIDFKEIKPPNNITWARFIRLQETEPAKVNFAFKPKSQGGAGYKEAVEYMNEYCGTNVKIPQI